MNVEAHAMIMATSSVFLGELGSTVDQLVAWQLGATCHLDHILRLVGFQGGAAEDTCELLAVLEGDRRVFALHDALSKLTCVTRLVRHLMKIPGNLGIEYRQHTHVRDNHHMQIVFPILPRHLSIVSLPGA